MKRKKSGILGNIRVLDFADERGSFCSRLLADLGADVLKVETTHGDSSRCIGPFSPDAPSEEPFSLSFIYSNINKRSLVLDLDSAEGKRVFGRLAQKADILVETCRPGYLENLNLGYEELYRANPRLIHLSISAFGRNVGPKV